MANTKAPSRRFADRDEPAVPDLDPEADMVGQQSAGSDSDDSQDDNAGTEHYVTVGQSKLRQKDAVSLGPQYRGARISRAALDEGSDEGASDGFDAGGDESEYDSGEESGRDGNIRAEEGASSSEAFDDPDAVDLQADRGPDEDAEIDSDEAFGDSDEERFKGFVFRGSSKPAVGGGKRSRRPTAADFLSSSEEDEHDGEEDGREDGGSQDEGGSDDSQDLSGSGEDDFSGVSLSDGEGNSDDDNDEEGSNTGLSTNGGKTGDNLASQRAELQRIMSEGQKSIVTSISQAVKADAEKGFAVRQQRRTFDSLLNIRIRLQKALVAANSFDVVSGGEDSDKAPYQAAEEAAIKLLDTIAGMRHSLLYQEPISGGQKRKPSIQVGTSSQSIWDGLESTEAMASTKRRKVLDKWSAKVRSTTAVATTRKLGSTPSQSLVSVLDDQLLNMDRIVKRARTPRSCAPVQAARKVNEDPNIYDDADFYQLLLKELVDQRTTDSSAPGESVATVRWSAIKEAKTRKQVDRKASKGRKLRFEVHEKLQNFMAPEDRRNWEQDAIDRLFGTLFGQKMELGEDEASDEEMGGASVEEEGLRLFRS